MSEPSIAIDGGHDGEFPFVRFTIRAPLPDTVTEWQAIEIDFDLDTASRLRQSVAEAIAHAAGAHACHQAKLN